MARRATIADLAARAGVSVSTIDRILNGRDPVRRSTAEKVLAAAEAIGFYAVPLLRERLGVGKPVVRLGFLLLQPQRTFYRMIAEAIHSAAALSPTPVETRVEHLADLSPEAVSAQMLALGERVDAIAVVAAEHPRITHAIETLAAHGVPTFGLISGLTASCGVGYLGLDNWKVGRTAAWAIAGRCKSPGQVGILFGNHRYRCQEMNESGFRSYFREHAPDFTLLEPISTYEDKSIARDVTETLLQREPDLVGIYVCGGGITGVLQAIAASGRSRRITIVGHELMGPTRDGLLDGLLAMAIAIPLARLATEAVALMCETVLTGSAPGQRVLNFDIWTPENV